MSDMSNFTIKKNILMSADKNQGS